MDRLGNIIDKEVAAAAEVAAAMATPPPSSPASEPQPPTPDNPIMCSDGRTLDPSIPLNNYGPEQ